MSGINRLPEPWGLLLDRSRTIEFEFERDRVSGLAGDTVASALAANNRWLLSRSFKYHRPRGVLTMAGQDANTLVQLPAKPNTLADRVLISDGLRVTGQNYAGRLDRDRDAWIQIVARFLPVGFYYKAFFRPRGAWNLWARYFRHKTGLGVIEQAFAAGRHDKQYRFCDVAVVGGGPAGMMTALQAAKAGADVLLVDENPVLGGSSTYTRSVVDASADIKMRDSILQQLHAQPNIEVMTNSVVNGCYADNWLAIIDKQRMHKLRARQVVLCTGALEQPAVFHNNDLPGVMLGTAAQRMISLYGVRPGKIAVVLAGNNDAYGVALDLLDAGVELACLVELRDAPPDDPRAREVMARGVEVLPCHAVYAAENDRRSGHLAAVEARRIVGQGQCADRGRRISCDLLCMSVGFMPTYQLACQAGGRLSYDDGDAQFAITNLPASLQLAGAVNNSWDFSRTQHDALRAAAAAVPTSGPSSIKVPVLQGDEEPARSPNHPWPIFAHPRGKEFVDFDEDLQIGDILNSVGDGYESIELVKRYSTCGMGPSQGRHSALATARLVAQATGKTVADTGVTTARPPFAAETLAHCAGRSFYPERRSNMHHRHLEAGAQMLQAGAWYRPAYYGDPVNQVAAIQDEVAQVRNAVGMIDVSTLGGIEVRGTDAAEFLNRVYTFAYQKQPAGKLRYVLMINEAGVVIDDGVACRLAEEHFYVTATTGGVDRVFRKMLWWNAQWRLDVSLANVTSAYCGLNVAGPASRDVLAPLCEGVDLSAAAFPYLAVREGRVAGIPARLLRVGFVGELGFEIHAPQHCGEALWDALVEAGASNGIKPFGVEAQRLLRLEKGHIIVGQDTDAMSNPMELQMDWAIARKKPFFVGGRTLDALSRRPLGRLLVGFEIGDAAAPVPRESHLVLDGDTMVGRVTSCGVSPTLDRTIGLAYVPPALAGPGSKLTIRCDDGVTVQADTVVLPFYDPENLRQAL